MYGPERHFWERSRSWDSSHTNMKFSSEILRLTRVRETNINRLLFSGQKFDVFLKFIIFMIYDFYVFHS